MEKYIKIIEEGNLNALTNSLYFNDLISIKYKGKYLIEYLLEKGIHTIDMDNYTKYNYLFAKFYLQYNILKPLINCSLIVLLKEYNNEILLDTLLSKLNYNEKMELYYSIKVNSYNEFRIKEDVIRKSYLKYGIVLPKIFMNVNSSNEKYGHLEDEILINEFKDVYKDHESNVINFIINELKKVLNINRNRGISDIQKLIDFKKKNPSFSISFSQDTEGEYVKKSKKMKISLSSPIVLSHEFSHLLFQEYEDDEIVMEYEKIRNKIDNINNFNKIKDYLKIFHQRFKEKQKELEKEYYNMVNDKYGSFDNYLEIVCKDILNNKKEFSIVQIYDKIYDLEVCDVKSFVLEFLKIEKNEYINNHARKFFGKKLMLENLLDALFMGGLCDDMDEECLSGHSGIYFLEKDSNSFDETLANFDALKKYDGDDLIYDLKQLVGEEIIVFLDNYLKKNREKGYGNR